MKNFILFVLFFATFISFTNLAIADTSNIEKLVFITNPQTVVPNEISKYITLQIQDVSGNQVVAQETIRFDAFQSTSATGIFVSCTTPTNPPTDYISKNNSNKNICYKDSTEGVYTITAKTNNTTNSLLATQQITISQSSGGGSGTTSTSTDSGTGVSTGTTTATSTTSGATSNGGSSYYVYSSPVSLSTYEPLSLNVEAGRERLGFLHAPLEFKSYTKDKKTGKNVSGAKYLWTFGDGTSGEGEEIVHTYLFPGEYNVVLNSSLGEVDAVDITKVKIITPQIKILVTGQYVELTNESTSDLNVGEWRLRGNSKEYIIPRDTIISALESIKIPNSVLTTIVGGEKIGLIYPDNQLALESVGVASEEEQKQIAEISEKLLSIQNLIYIAYQDRDTLTQSTYELDEKMVATEEIDNESIKEGEATSLANVSSSPVSKNIISKIIDFFATMFK